MRVPTAVAVVAMGEAAGAGPLESAGPGSPVAGVPVVDELVLDQLVVAGSMVDRPVGDELVVAEPVVDRSVADRPVAARRAVRTARACLHGPRRPR